MDTIPFPSNYRQPLRNGTKTVTLRLAREIGKYQEGQTYEAASYAGRKWGLKIRIKKVIATKIGKLPEFGIPKRTIEALLKKDDVSPATTVEIIEFSLIDH